MIITATVIALLAIGVAVLAVAVCGSWTFRWPLRKPASDAELLELASVTVEPRHHSHERLASTGEMAAVPDELARRRAGRPT